MKKFFRRLVGLLLVLLAGYFLFQSGLIENQIIPQLQQTLRLPADSGPDRELDSENTSSSAAAAEDSALSSAILVPADQFQPPPETVDAAAIRQEILQLTNDLRQEKDVGILEQNNQLQEAADIRAEETSESFSHTRPDGQDFYTVLNEDGIHYFYAMAGENLAMATHHLSDQEMARFLFEGWVESPGHYENLIHPDFQEIGIGVYYDGEFLYLTQLFGRPY